jgi:polyferredoxin
VEAWGGWFLFGLFAAILVWEEVWDLPQTAYLSSWLLLLITAGAVVCSAFFERRLWCRYLCPIGGMNGEHCHKNHMHALHQRPRLLRCLRLMICLDTSWWHCAVRACAVSYICVLFLYLVLQACLPSWP